jgi:hypothetical protein
MKIKFRRLDNIPIRVVPVFILLVACASTASFAQVRIIDRQGKHIQSVYDGTSPNIKIQQRYLTTKGSEDTSPYTLLNANYREYGTGRLLRVCGTCQGHYQVDMNRPCGSSCQGGSENWTFSDAAEAPYCIGYVISFTGCNTKNCQEEYTCPNGLCE